MAAAGQCPFFAQGSCMFGDRCKRSHSIGLDVSPNAFGQRSPAISSKSARPTPIKTNNKKTCTFFLQGKCTKGSSCPFLHPENEAPSSSKTAFTLRDPCKFFASSGSCKNGTACPFRHEIPRRISNASSSIASSSVPSTPTSPANFGSHTFSSKIEIACVYFRQGRCAKGELCPFLHIKVPNEYTEPPSDDVGDEEDEAPSADTESSEEEAKTETSTRMFYQCTVPFSDGASIGKIQTPFDSYTVIMRNLPFHTTQTEIHRIAEPFGPLRTANVYPNGEFASASIEYLDFRDARNAVEELTNNTPILPSAIQNNSMSPISAHLDLLSGKASSEKAVLRSTKVRATWFAPSPIAWAHYSTIAEAQHQAQRLNKAAFRGQPITSMFQKPNARQRTSFSVILSNLPQSIKINELRRFCVADSIDIKKPKQTLLAQEAIINALLSQHGILDAFDSLPKRRESPKVSAIAQFASPEEAVRAVSILHNTKQVDLNNSPVYAEIIHSIKYQLPHSQFTALLGDLERIAATNLGENVKMRWYSADPDGKPIDPVVLRAYSASPQNLGQVKHELDTILRGEVLCYNGKILWSNDWEDIDRPAILSKISTSTEVGEGVELHADHRVRTVRFYGDDTKQGLCERLLYSHLSSLRTTFQLDQPQKVRVVMADLPRLRLRFSTLHITLNVVDKVIEITGGDRDGHDRVKEELAALLTGPLHRRRASKSSGGDACPVCFCPVDEDKVELDCSHTFCRSCLELLILSSNLLECPFNEENNGTTPPCGHPIPLRTIRQLLSPEAEIHLLKKVFITHVNSHPAEFAYCPTPDCEMVYRPDDHSSTTVLTCPSCLTRICPSCRVGYHEGLTCAEHRDQAAGGFKAFQKWKEGNSVKSCPKCGTDIQKEGGCNHMKCARCGIHMCWICLQQFDDSRNGGESVYDHLTRKHGGAF